MYRTSLVLTITVLILESLTTHRDEKYILILFVVVVHSLVTVSDYVTQAGSLTSSLPSIFLYG